MSPPPFQLPTAAPGQARVLALLPCAGLGSRAGTQGPKQYHPLAGQPMVGHTLWALAQVGFDAALLVLAPGDTGVGVDLPSGFFQQDCGGATRADSVLNGLEALALAGASAHDWVLVHDAARCLVDPADVLRLIRTCEHDTVGGLLALPLADTLKAADTDATGVARCHNTLTRGGKWLAQTPQMFRLGLLSDALHAARGQGFEHITDEASAIEALGRRPRLVPGNPMNFKLTYPADFALAEVLLQHRKSLS
ncbi:2-C-methyl-D-erythritol 4-phosphate cytidylyltransferase [Hydrogenophaga sp. OTU3427]|uniref:2-C-methyl-D-erythritol 4-phosphate cytidylyltransferase n=1 Tax=Hydrogenophaga sp. OTU3427 TaxID=3043856 RepID=UPI00313C6B88